MPSTSHSSQSGFRRSSCWEKIRAARLTAAHQEPGDGQGGLADVVIEVQVRVVDQDRPALAERHVAQLLAEARHEVQARGDVVAEFLVRGGRWPRR